MPKGSFNVVYTEEALLNMTQIRNFILLKFTQREVENFYKILFRFEDTVSVFPEIYPESFKGEDTRRAVLSKQLSVFYIVYKKQVSIVGMIDNRMGYDKWPQ